MPDKTIRRPAESVYIKVKGPLTRKGARGLIALTNTALIIKPLGYTKRELHGDELKDIQLERKRSGDLLVIHYDKWTYKVMVSDAHIRETEIRLLHS